MTSRAPISPCSLDLAFWCQGDRVRVDRLFRRSGLYRPKWERDDYRTSSIALACEPYTTRSPAERTDRPSATPPTGVEDILASLPDDAEPAVIGQALHELARLAEGADALGRQTLRETAIKALKRFSLSSPAKMVDAALSCGETGDDATTTTLTIPEVEPWNEPVEGAQLLQTICDTFARFIVLPDGAGEALALWVLYSYVSDAFFVWPRLALNSPGQALRQDQYHVDSRQAGLSTASREQHSAATSFARTSRVQADSVRHGRGGDLSQGQRGATRDPQLWPHQTHGLRRSPGRRRL